MFWLKNPSESFLYDFDGISFTFSGFIDGVSLDDLNEFAYIEDEVTDGDIRLVIRADLVTDVDAVKISDFASVNPRIKRLTRVYIGNVGYFPFFDGSIRPLV